MSRIGYAKLGRSWQIGDDKGTATGGDVDVRHTLQRLARSHPQHEFVLVGRNSLDDTGLSNVTNPWVDIMPHVRERARDWVRQPNGQLDPPSKAKALNVLRDETAHLFENLDGIVVWAGQHGTHNSSVPLITREGQSIVQDNFLLYGSYLILGINAWRDAAYGRREEVWICPDPRNELKCRDLKWPLQRPVLAQFNHRRNSKHYRFSDPTPPETYGFNAKTDDEHNLWVTTHDYAYDAVELTALPDPSDVPLSTDHANRYDFGVLLNENRATVTRSRLDALRTWVLPLWPDAEVFGRWSKASQQRLGREIRECPRQYLWSTLQRWRCTITTPASGSGWATAKPWECFAAGTVCFFHPSYDTQNHILRDAPELARWLRVDSPDRMRRLVEHLRTHPGDWLTLVNAQRAHYERRFAETNGGIHRIEERLQI